MYKDDKSIGKLILISISFVVFLLKVKIINKVRANIDDYEQSFSKKLVENFPRLSCFFVEEKSPKVKHPQVKEAAKVNETHVPPPVTRFYSH